MAKATSNNSSGFLPNEDAVKRIKNLLEDIYKLEQNLTEEDTVQKEIIEEKQKKLAAIRKDLIANRGIIKSTNDLESARLDSMSSLASTVKTLPKLYESLSKELKTSQSFANEMFNSAKNVNNEWAQDKFLNVAKSLEAGTSLIAELAQLNKEDVAEIAKKNFEIDNNITAIQKEKEELAYAGILTKELASTFDAMTGYLNSNRAAAGKFASQSEKVKEIYSELSEELHSINKFFKKITTTVEVFLGSTRGKIALLAFGAGEIAEKFGEMGKEIGVGMTQMVGLKTQVGLVGAILGDTAGEAAMDLAKDLGDSHHLTTSMAVDAGLLAANYGLSAKQAAFMSTAFGELSGKSYEAGKNTGEYVKQLAMANGVAPSQVMKDVADNTEFFALYSQDGGKNIGDAAVAAAKLGVGLGTAEKMANHLLDYQSSVQDEMEASVLLGRDLNLGKARELAYNNDIAGAMKEGLKAVGGIAKWNGMTRYEREATAKALGVSAGEMQQMVAHEETLNGMHGVGNQIYSQTAEILQNMGNSLTGKVLKGMGGLVIGAGELNKGLQGMGTSIGGMARGTKQMLKNLFAMLAPTKILSKLKQFGGAIANTKVGSAIGGIAGKAKDYIAEKAGGLKDKLMDKVDFSGKAEEMVGEKKDAVVDSIKDKISPEKVTEDADKAGAGGDDLSGFKDKMTNMSAGLKELASGKVVMGALALIPIGIGLMGLLPGLPTLYLMGKMNFGSVLLGFENLSLGLSALGTGSALAGAGVLALTSIALIMMLPGLAVLAIMGAMAPLITLGFGAITAGLTSLGAAAPVAAIGVGILLGLASAFAIFGAGVMFIGLGIKLAMDGITSLISVMPLLAENLGPLIGMILPIFGLAAAIMALSLSLMMLGTMGMVALPVLLALGALGAVAGGLFGGGEGGGGSSNDEMISILKSIDSKVGGTPAINMDSKRITTASNDGAARRGDSGGTKY
jgi:hypothetical protein